MDKQLQNFICECACNSLAIMAALQQTKKSNEWPCIFHFIMKSATGYIWFLCSFWCLPLLFFVNFLCACNSLEWITCSQLYFVNWYMHIVYCAFNIGVDVCILGGIRRTCKQECSMLSQLLGPIWWFASGLPFHLFGDLCLLRARIYFKHTHGFFHWATCPSAWHSFH